MDSKVSGGILRDIIASMAKDHISEADRVPELVGPIGANPPRRSLSESIALAEVHTKELGYAPVMDAEFAADMEEIIRSRKPGDRSAWD
jgi:hypothetical protein